jgi:transposase
MATPQRAESPTEWPDYTRSSRDQRLQVKTLRDAGFTQMSISKQLDISRDKVRYAIAHPATPSKRSGRPSPFTEEQLTEIIEWICALKQNRRTAYKKIPKILNLDVSFYAVQNALRRAGFARCVARRKPSISERNRLARLKWAQEHIHWTPEQWRQILWTDEMWQNGSRHIKTWVTRRVREKWDPTYIVERHQRRAE